MGSATQIRNARVRAGKSAGEVARHLGLNEAWYDDLEHHDDELASTLTLFQALELAAFVNVPLSDLLDEGAVPDERIPLLELPARIEAHLARSGISIEKFEQEIAWELAEFLRSPLKVAAQFPMIFLQDLAAALRIPWLAFLPADARSDGGG